MKGYLLNDLVANAKQHHVLRVAVRLGFLGVFLTHMSTAQDSKPPKVSTDTHGRDSTALCRGIDTEHSAELFFSDPEGKNAWRECRKIQNVPEIETWGRLANFWTGRRGNFLVRMQEPTEDWGTSTDYCFSKFGQLIAVRFELRTAWGWGYREEGPVIKGLFAPDISGFFDTQSDSPIARPEMANDIPDALKPQLYIRKSRLPFAKLLRN